MPQRLMDEIAALKIGMVGLPEDAGPKFPAQLSGGMRKRAGLARALALDPEIVFLDEPTAGLDPIAAGEFDNLIRDLKSSLGLTVFMVTHDLDSLFAICDRVAVLVDKKIRVGTLDQLLHDDHPWIRSYFHGPRGPRGAARRGAACAAGPGSDRGFGLGSKKPRSRRGRMETRAHYVAVGAFVLIVVFAAFAAVLWLGRRRVRPGAQDLLHLFPRVGRRTEPRLRGPIQRHPGRTGDRHSR